MLTIEKLKEYGADVEEGVTRCIGREDLYLNLVKMILDEKNFEKLEQSIKDNDLDSAFEAAHTLKGVLGNLSLTPMYLKAQEITELLRNKTEADYPTLVKELFESKEAFNKLFED